MTGASSRDERTPDQPAEPAPGDHDPELVVDRRLTRRGVQLLAGLVLFSASIGMIVHSGLGNMPWDVLGQGVAVHLGWTLGTTTLVLSVLVLACWFPLRQRPGAGTIANVVVIGLLVDPFLALLDLLPADLDTAGRVALVVGGIALNGVASGLYIGARLGPGPRDGLMTGLVARTGRPVHLVRTSIEVLVVAVGWVLGGTVGLATLAYALCIGPLVHLLLPRLTVPQRPAGPVPGR
ncbi:YitT family protein [Cellulomonas sp. P22]|uniref:membrane protein YczE n=1 Tax=Cellulomonas sp. P22 TaxID=3373189 RepID=UPI0037896BE9